MSQGVEGSELGDDALARPSGSQDNQLLRDIPLSTLSRDVSPMNKTKLSELHDIRSSTSSDGLEVQSRGGVTKPLDGSDETTPHDTLLKLPSGTALQSNSDVGPEKI
jgi:hypothetical protein